MEVIRIVVLCIAAALLCTAVKSHRPEIALGMSLAVSIGALLIIAVPFSEIISGIRHFTELSTLSDQNTDMLIRAAGITILAELGGQICSDTGETALAGRIRLAARIVMLAAAMPIAMQLIDGLLALL